MPRSLAQLSASESSHRDLSSAGFITNIVESDFRYTQPTEVSNFAQTQLGRSAYLRPNLSTRNAAFGVYEIRATLPAEEGQFRYRIKSQIELHERVVKESELSEA
jgi:hypothetical protein